MRGKIKVYFETKGYGFIGRDDGADVFFHITQVAPDEYEPLKNDTVSFDLTENNGRPCAMNVRSA